MGSPVHNGIGMVAKWTRASFGGWCLGFVMMLLLLAVTGSLGLGDMQFGLGLGMGLGVGIIQARTGFVQARRAWIMTSGIGMALPFMLKDVLNFAGVPLPYLLPQMIATGGFLTGLLQARAAEYRGQQFLLWMVASGVGWTLAGATAALADLIPRTFGPIGALYYIAVVLLGGFALGAVEGAAIQKICEDQPVVDLDMARSTS